MEIKPASTGTEGKSGCTGALGLPAPTLQPALLQASNPARSVQGALLAGAQALTPVGASRLRTKQAPPAARSGLLLHTWAPDGSWPWPHPHSLPDVGPGQSVCCDSCTKQSSKLPASGSPAAHSLLIFPTPERSS